MLKQERPTNLFSSIGFISIFAAFGFGAQPEIIKMCHGDFSPEVYVPLILKGSAGIAGSAGLMQYDPMLYTNNGIAGRSQEQAIGNLNRIQQTPISVEPPQVAMTFSDISADPTIKKAAKDVATIAKDALTGDVVGAVGVALSNTGEIVEAVSEVRAIAKQDISNFEKANGIANKVGAFAGGVLGVGFAAFKGLYDNVAPQSSAPTPIRTINLPLSNVSDSARQLVATRTNISVSEPVKQVSTDVTLASELAEVLIPNDTGVKNAANVAQQGASILNTVAEISSIANPIADAEKVAEAILPHDDPTVTTVESVLKIASNPVGSLLGEIENAKF